MSGRIRAQYGAECQILAFARAHDDTFFFVADYPQRMQLRRLLGSVGTEGRIVEHSAMDLLHPERLVFPYERMMLVSLALVEKPRRALLLGLGGGALLRHLKAYFPSLAVTVVERDPAVLDLARRYFHLDAPVIEGDALEVLAQRPRSADLVLVDLYDTGGPTVGGAQFWADCRRALTPGGALAINWADLMDRGRLAHELATRVPDLERGFFLIERGPNPNIVQLAPPPGFAVADLGARFAALARARKLPREDRDILERCHPPAPRLLDRPPRTTLSKRRS